MTHDLPALPAPFSPRLERCARAIRRELAHRPFRGGFVLRRASESRAGYIGEHDRGPQNLRSLQTLGANATVHRRVDLFLGQSVRGLESRDKRYSEKKAGHMWDVVGQA